MGTDPIFLIYKVGTFIGRAVSNARAAQSNSASAYFGPTMCRPTGRPDLVKPQGIDAAGCWDLPQLWPPQVIVMTLERVGADAGPDLETIAGLSARAPHAQLIGAGGIRSAADLERAAATGAWAWLVASALHDDRLPAVRR